MNNLAMGSLLMAAALALAGCRPSAPPAVAPRLQPLAPGLELATAALTPFPAVVSAPGTVEARTAVTLAAQVQAPIAAVTVSLGDRVRKGEVLVRLNRPEAGEGVAQAQAAVAAAGARLDAARRQRAAVQAESDLAAATLRRYDNLKAEDAVSPHEFETVVSASRADAARLAAAAADETAAGGALAQAQAALAEARTGQGYSHITAPMDGVVTAKLAEAGELAQPGEPLLRIESDGGWQLVASVPARWIAGLYPGQSLQARIADAAGGDALYAVTLREIAPAADPLAQSAWVKADLPGVAGLRAGVYGELLLPETTAAEAGVRVPRTAVLQRGELEEMVVIQDGGLALRLVSTGAVVAGQVEILSGLNPGERYLLQPQKLASPDEP